MTYLQRIEWFIGLVLLQVLVLNHMHINGYATPFFFIYFIFIGIPETTKKTSSAISAIF